MGTMGKLDGKVAFITGAARGQGRSHAVRLAQEGADIIALDLCAQIDTVPYPLATPADLAETARQVEDLGQRIVTQIADVRDAKAMRAAVEEGLAEMGHIDIVIVNAGIAPMGVGETDSASSFRDVIDVNLIGVWNTVEAARPSMEERGEGGAVILISSTAGLKGIGGTSGGGAGYVASKHAVVGLMRNFATSLARFRIRVNSVHPTGVNTPMADNDAMKGWLASDPRVTAGLANLLPVEMLESNDISNAIVWLVSDDALYVTGVALPIDAGFTIK